MHSSEYINKINREADNRDFSLLQAMITVEDRMSEIAETTNLFELNETIEKIHIKKLPEVCIMELIFSNDEQNDSIDNINNMLIRYSEENLKYLNTSIEYTLAISLNSLEDGETAIIGCNPFFWHWDDNKLSLLFFDKNIYFIDENDMFIENAEK